MENDWMGQVFRCQSLMFCGCINEILEFFFWLCERNLSQITDHYWLSGFNVLVVFYGSSKNMVLFLWHKLVLLFEKGITVPHSSLKKIHPSSKAPRVNPWSMAFRHSDNISSNKIRWAYSPFCRHYITVSSYILASMQGFYVTNWENWRN